MQENQPQRTLVKKLAVVMKEVKRIEKNGFNKFHGYKFATEADVSEAVREVLADQNVIMLPDVVEHSIREHINNKGKTEYIATVKVKFTFIDGDSGESLSLHGLGEGQDAGDKAVYKAITGAQKYALMKAFMIPTGDDPEAGQPNGQQPNQQQGRGRQPYQNQNQNNRSRQQGQNNRQNHGQQNRQTDITRGMLHSQYIAVGGTADQFDGWYSKQREKGRNNIQMKQILDNSSDKNRGAS